MKGIKLVDTRVRRAILDSSIDRQRACVAVVLVLLLYASSVMMFFGMNFWLWSFTPGIQRSYATILIPSLLWCGLFLVTCGLDAGYSWLRHKKLGDYFFWTTKTGLVLIVFIGFFDSLTGLTGMYAAVHVTQILQSALISTGPIWTFLLAHILYPSSQPKFHPFLIVVFVLTVGGVTLAMVPQILDRDSPRKYFSLPWTVIYLASTVLFPLYNVLQGRFLHEFRGHCTPFTRKMVMLTAETTVQLFLTVGYFPVDFSPFYGRCSSAEESWENLVASLRCISSCPNNAKYMMVYVLGFWIRHVVFAYLNTYSPSVAAVTSMLTQPINAFILLAVPSWNVFGSKKDWRYTLGCFFCLLFAMVTFVLWHLTLRQPDTEEVCSDGDTSASVVAVPLEVYADLLAMEEDIDRKYNEEEMTEGEVLATATQVCSCRQDKRKESVSE